MKSTGTHTAGVDEDHIKEAAIERIQKYVRSKEEAASIVDALYRRCADNLAFIRTADSPETLLLLRQNGTYQHVDNISFVISVDSPKMLSLRQREGVHDEDIKRWWEKPALEKRMDLNMEELERALNLKCIMEEEGVTLDKAMRLQRKRLPVYGMPEDYLHSQDPEEENLFLSILESPLPYELKYRVDEYLTQRFAGNRSALQRESEASSSVNAFIRNQIRLGNI